MDRSDTTLSPQVFVVVDGKPDEGNALVLEEAPQIITITMDDAAHRCRACTLPVVRDEHTGQWVDEDGAPYCVHAERIPGVSRLHGGVHEPQPMPFSWLTDISVEFDEEAKQVRVTASLAGRNGDLALTLRQVSDESHNRELAGKILVHVPFPSDTDTGQAALIHEAPGVYTIG